MESWSRQATERETTHLPLGERPTAYPPGIDGPGPGFSGDLLVRVTVTSADTDAGLPMAEPAPVPKKRATACNAKQARSVHADELPVVSRMAIATGMSDDPGWLGVHGPRITAGYGPGGPTEGSGDTDTYRGANRQPVELPIGGVLVSRANDRSTERKGWNIWRVLPAGPAAVLEATVDDDPEGGERIAIARAIDRNIHEAFEEAVNRLTAAGAHTTQKVLAGIASWTAAENRRVAVQGTGRNRARRRQRR